MPKHTGSKIKIAKWPELEALPQATANVSGYPLEEVLKRGKHRCSQWGDMGIYAGLEMGGRLSDVSSLFNRTTASGFQGSRRIREQILDDEGLQELSDQIREEAKKLARKENENLLAPLHK